VVSSLWFSACTIMQMFIDLQNNNDEGSIVTVFVSGNPGCGKSQIARQVGERFTADNQDGSTFVMT
jgi:adenylylsulfate kinase-like enzyme